MNDIQIDIAQEKLSDWLEEQEEMDQNPPAKIKFALGVRDPKINNLIFFVFKFKQTAKGKWLLGIAGGYPDEDTLDCPIAYSVFTEFPEELEEAANQAIEMASVLLMFSSKDRSKSAFEQNLKYVSSPVDVEKIAGQFVKTQSRTFLTIGTVDIPSGRVVVADPLCYMAGDSIMRPVLEKEIPKGSYPVEISLFRNRKIGIRICTARLKIKQTDAVRYELARPTPETQFPMGQCLPPELEDGVACGFPVDAGMMCFIDAEGAEDYEQFILNFHKNNPGKNHYDDYFKVFFMLSAQQLPQYQREEGDFIEWKNPINDQRMVMAASGLGDGIYLCFWGYDEDEEICELIVPMVDPDLFEDSDDDYYDEDEDDDDDYDDDDEDDDDDDDDDEDDDDDDEDEDDLNTRWQEAYQANPHMYGYGDDDGLLVNFALTEDTDSIFPIVPEEHWAVDGKTIDKWILSIFSITKDSVLGTIEYHEAMKRLEKHFLAENDGWVLIEGLNLDELEELFDGLPRSAL